MREIKGYVFIGDLYGRRILFGKGTKKEIYSSFALNGMTPYSSEKRVLSVCYKLRKEENLFGEITPASLEMCIAEKEEELEFFRDKTSLIFISNPNPKDPLYGAELYGPRRPGEQGFDGRSLLEVINFRTFRRVKPKDNSKNKAYAEQFIESYVKTPFEEADYEAKELFRQMGGSYPVTLATFKLKRIKI